jgi:hypothetical protein
MARRRVIDWKKLSKKLRKKPFVYRDLFKGIFACADDYGLCLLSILDIARVFLSYELDHGQVTLKKCETTLEEILSDPDPTFITWETGGEKYIAIIKWQDYQHVRHAGNADCPCPTEETLSLLSELSRKLITENLQKFTSFSDSKLQNLDHLKHTKKPLEVEEEDEEEVEGEVEGGDSVKSPGCSFCPELKNNPTEIQLLVKTCHDAWIASHDGKHPTFSAGRWIGILDRLKCQHGRDRVQQVYLHYLKSADDFISDKGFSITLFESKFDGVAQALDRGEIHGIGKKVRSGENREFNQAGSRRHPPSPSGSFPSTGEVKL